MRKKCDCMIWGWRWRNEFKSTEDWEKLWTTDGWVGWPLNYPYFAISRNKHIHPEGLIQSCGSRWEYSGVGFSLVTTRKPSCRWQTNATRKHAKIVPIRRTYNVVADNTGLARLAVVASELPKSAKSREILGKFKLEFKVIDLDVNRKRICNFLSQIVTLDYLLQFSRYWYI